MPCGQQISGRVYFLVSSVSKLLFRLTAVLLVTGVCECTGMLSPILGGGHGWLQGHYGLIADQLIEARLVLANGTAVTVSSTLNPDLFWALRGAGHNFGVVTEFKVKIYDAPSTTWTYDEFIFTHDKLEALYEQFNRLHNNGTQPAGLIHWSVWLRLPDMDPEHVRPAVPSKHARSADADQRSPSSSPISSTKALPPKNIGTEPPSTPSALQPHGLLPSRFPISNQPPVTT
jgi:hypothetical protein